MAFFTHQMKSSSDLLKMLMDPVLLLDILLVLVPGLCFISFPIPFLSYIACLLA